MNKIKERIMQCNFRKWTKTYLTALIVTMIVCLCTAGYVFREKISTAWQYSRLSDTAEKNSTANLNDEADKLASTSSDIIDVLVLDSQNQILHSAKNSGLFSGRLTLHRNSENQDYLIADSASNIALKYAGKDAFLLSSVLSTDNGTVRNDYEDSSFYEADTSGKTVYMLGYIKEKTNGGKIYVISQPASVAGGSLTIKAIEAAVVFFFMVYWAGLAVWIYQDAAKAKLPAWLWGLVVLFTNVVGVLVYQIYKHASLICPNCGASQSRQHHFCSCCGAVLGQTCRKCGAQIHKEDQYCPNCGSKIN